MSEINYAEVLFGLLIMTSNQKLTPEEIKKGGDTGLMEENIDLANQQEFEVKTDPEKMMPHERDETAGAKSTQSSEGAHSREKIHQAHRDTEQGLEDTDCRGTPSNIIRTDTCSHPSTKKDDSK